jgi:hypothetical protein
MLQAEEKCVHQIRNPSDGEYSRLALPHSVFASRLFELAAQFIDLDRPVFLMRLFAQFGEFGTL